MLFLIVILQKTTTTDRSAIGSTCIYTLASNDYNLYKLEI